MEIDSQAPVLAEDDILIDATDEDVWNALTDFTSWPKWNSEVDKMFFEGKLVPGAHFEWKGHGLTMAARLEEVIPAERIVWSCSMFGKTKAIHVWILYPTPDGVRIVTRLSLSGLLPRLFPKFFKTRVKASIMRMLVEFRTYAEDVVVTVPKPEDVAQPAAA